MKYLMLVCGDGIPAAEKAAALEEHPPPSIDGWVSEMDGRGVRLMGNVLESPQSAKTVRVRDGETLTIDGPFAATKEYIAGFDLVECESLDEAIDVASKHPMSWSDLIEVRPLAGDTGVPQDWGYEQLRFMLMPCMESVPESPEVEQALSEEGQAWLDELRRRDVLVLGTRTADASTATTVRVRNGETLLTDGPFAETKEFLGGAVILSCKSLDEAVDLAGMHPLARFRSVEVRPFWEG